MSTLDYFFNIDRKDTKELFKGLKIMEQGEEYISKQGYYPCVFLSFADVKTKTFDDMIYGIKTVIHEVYDEFRYLLESDKLYEDEKEYIKNILNFKADKNELITSIKQLSNFLSKHYERSPIILIDEYDVPIQESYAYEYYDDAVLYMKQFYSASLKNNKYIEKAVLTGVSRVAKESIFSDMNDISVYTIMDKYYADDFGFTSDEMDKIINDFEVQEEKEEIKKWYDGYKIGNVENIYNPWSVLNYLKYDELKSYWVNTSSNDIIKMVLTKSYTVKEKMERLLEDESIEVVLNLKTELRDIEKKEDNIWGLFVQSGYLNLVEKIDNKRCKVKIPNYEIKELFEDITNEWFINSISLNPINDIIKDLVEENYEEYEKKFRLIVKEVVSYMDVGENIAENFYHAFVLGMLVNLKDKYYIRSNRESGFGRYDIMLEPKEKEDVAFIMEFKVYENDYEENIEKTLQKAKEQIIKKDYETELKNRGYNNIVKVVYAFNGKDVKLECYK